MSLFRRKPERIDVGRLADLEREVHALRGRVQDIELEWTNAYEKLAKLQTRIRKRAERAAEGTEAHDPAHAPITNPLALQLMRGRDGVLPSR